MSAFDDDRGQTGFDFLVGMTVFLLTVGFIFTFTPGMFRPFDAATPSNMQVADRAAASLTGSLLVTKPGQPADLDEGCTEQFFAGGPTTGCRFDASADNLHKALGIEQTTVVNVSIESSNGVVSRDGVRLAAGPSPPDTADVFVGKRLARVGGDRLAVFVRVW